MRHRPETIVKIISLGVVGSLFVACSEWLAPTSSRPATDATQTDEVDKDPGTMGTYEPGPLVGVVGDASGNFPEVMQSTWAELLVGSTGNETVLHITNDLVFANRFREISGYEDCAIFTPPVASETIYDIAVTLHNSALNNAGLPKQTDLARSSVDDGGAAIDIALTTPGSAGIIGGAGSIAFAALRERNDGNLDATVNLTFPREGADALTYKGAVTFPVLTVPQNPENPTCPNGQRAVPKFRS